MYKLNAKQLRTEEPDESEIAKIKRNPLYIILDNVYDTYNIGSIFRLADAVCAEKIYLCGETETPPNHRIKKASINTWKYVPWEYADSVVEAIKTLKSSIVNLKSVAVEQSERSISIYDFKPEFPLCITIGNETNGVSEEALKLSDDIVELPMWGVNKSLNVMVSLGIFLYTIAENLNK